MADKVCCPKCGSDQLSADKKGFSVGKAVAGSLLVGGVLMGFAGSNKVIITCLKCGKTFKPGEGKIISTAFDSTNFSSGSELSAGDIEMLRIARQKGKLAAISYIKAIRNFDLVQATDYVNELAQKQLVTFGNDKPKQGCVALIVLVASGFAFIIGAVFLL